MCVISVYARTFSDVYYNNFCRDFCNSYRYTCYPSYLEYHTSYFSLKFLLLVMCILLLSIFLSLHCYCSEYIHFLDDDYFIVQHTCLEVCVGDVMLNKK